MQTDKPMHSFPCPRAATTLTPPTDHRQPEPCGLVNEATQAMTVARDGVIVQPALHNTSQPAARFAERTMHTFSQLLFDLPKFDQSSLVLVQLQAKPGKPCVECFQTRGRLVVVFEANHKVICVTHYHDIAATALTPPLNPQIEDVVQIHVRQQRCPVATFAQKCKTDRALRRTDSGRRPFAIFTHSCS